MQPKQLAPPMNVMVKTPLKVVALANEPVSWYRSVQPPA